MKAIVQNVFTLLVTFPGNLVYHTVLSFSIAGALYGAFSLREEGDTPQARRMIIGLSILLGLRVLMFTSAIIIQYAQIDNPALLPIIDRTITSLSLIIIVWFWAFPTPSKDADSATISLGLLTFLISFTLGLWWYQREPQRNFNGSILDIGWETYNLFLLVTGILLLIIRGPKEFGHGLGMMITLALGHIFHLGSTEIGQNLPNAVRFAQMAAYPILLTLPHRFDHVEDRLPIHRAVERVSKTETHDFDPYLVEPRILRLLSSVLNEKSPDKVYNTIARFVSEMMHTDMCLLCSSFREEKQFVILGGYERVQEHSLGKFILNKDHFPLLTSAIEKSRSMRLPASSTSPDISNLKENLNLRQSGHLLVGAIPVPAGSPPLGLILVSTHSDRRWNPRDEDYLLELTEVLKSILASNEQMNLLTRERENIRQTQEVYGISH